MIGLMVRFVLVSGVLLLLVVETGLSFMSAFVEARVVMSESFSGSRGAVGWPVPEGGQVVGLCWLSCRVVRSGPSVSNCSLL